MYCWGVGAIRTDPRTSHHDAISSGSWWELRFADLGNGWESRQHASMVQCAGVAAAIVSMKARLP